MVLMAKQTHRKYHHKKDYQFFKDDMSVGHLIIDFKMSKSDLNRELLEFAELKNADRIVLHWTALEGIVDREVNL